MEFDGVGTEVGLAIPANLGIRKHKNILIAKELPGFCDPDGKSKRSINISRLCRVGKLLNDRSIVNIVEIL